MTPADIDRAATLLAQADALVAEARQIIARDAQRAARNDTNSALYQAWCLVRDNRPARKWLALARAA